MVGGRRSVDVRGWLAGTDLTEAGAAGRRAIEDATDRAAERGFAALAAHEREELDELLARFAEVVVSSGSSRIPTRWAFPVLSEPHLRVDGMCGRYVSVRSD